MQYILSQEEYHELNKTKEHKKALEVARRKILDQAKFACIHDIGAGTCNGCPISPMHKMDDYQGWKLICGQETRYDSDEKLS